MANDAVEFTIDGVALLNEISSSLKDHVIFSKPEEADAVTLWCAGTYLMDVWQLWPKLYIHSPERECGKTTLLSAVEAVVKNGQMTANITASALYRLIELKQPTLCIDEADRFLGDNQELNGIINAGHTRRTAKKILTEPTKDGGFRVTEFSLWGAQVIAGIGQQADTLLSRSVKIALRRKRPFEKVNRMRLEYFDNQKPIREKLQIWATQNSSIIKELNDGGPEGASDRAQDNWTALIKIAKAVGGEWPRRANIAFQKMEVTYNDDNSISQGIELLQDIQSLIQFIENDHIPAKRLREALVGMEDANWRRQNYGRPISDKWLAKNLRQYQIKSVKLRDYNAYFFSEINDAVMRYIQ